MTDIVWREDHVPERSLGQCSANGLISSGSGEWLCQHGFGNEASTHLRTFFQSQEEHANYLHIRFVVRWGNPGGSLSSDQLDVFLNADQVSTIEANVSAESPPETNVTRAHRAKRKGDDANETLEKWWHLIVHTTTSNIHASNLFTDKTYGDQQGTVEALRELFRSKTVFHLLLWGRDLNEEASELLNSMGVEKQHPPLAKWYPSLSERRQRNFFIQLGQYAEKDARPKYEFKTKIPFSSQDEYTTVLGFGAIQEHEYEFDAAQSITCDQLRLRLMTIPGAGNRRYLAFLECPEGMTARIQPGDILKINFEPEIDDRADDWHAVAVPPMPFAPIFDVSLLLTRPWKRNEKQWATLPDGVRFNPVDIAKCRDGPTARKAITEAHYCEVNVRLQLSDKPFRQQINSLRQLTDHPGHPMWPLLLANNLETKDVEKVDMYSTIPDDFSDIIARARFNDRQREAFNMLRKLPWGFGMFQGPPGTGKTYWILNVVLPLIAFDKRSTANDIANDRHQVLITGPANDPITDSAVQLGELVAKLLPRRDAVIVRCHSIMTEGEVAWHPATKERGLEDNARPQIIQAEDEIDGELGDMLAATTVKDFYENATKRPHGVADTRLRSIEQSLGTWMLKFAGILESPFAQPDRFRYFVQSFRQWRNGEQFESEDLGAFRQQTKDLRQYVLSRADVVLATLSLAGTQGLSSVLKPDVVIIDEAAKPTEPETWNALANYQPRVKILVGDHQQLKPGVQSNREDNNFGGQLSLSLFARLRFAGFPTVMFEEQHRMHPLISALVSKISYNRALRDSPLVKVEARATTIVRGVNKELYGIDKPFLFLNVAQSRDKAGPQNSRENLINVAVVMTHVERLILHCSLAPGEIVVLVPYRAQYLRYLSAMTLFHEKYRHIDLRALLVRTIDSFQGNERPVTFVDLTVTDKIGFVRDGSRLNVALSRAQYASYVIGSADNIDSLKREGKFLQGMLSYARRNKALATVADVPESPYVDVDSEMFRSPPMNEGDNDDDDATTGWEWSAGAVDTEADPSNQATATVEEASATKEALASGESEEPADAEATDTGAAPPDKATAVEKASTTDKALASGKPEEPAGAKATDTGATPWDTVIAGEDGLFAREVPFGESEEPAGDVIKWDWDS